MMNCNIRKQWRLKLCGLATLVLLLTGCAQPDSSFNAPPLVTYDQEFQKQASEELQQYRAKAPHVAEMIDDYGNLRAAIWVGAAR